jgi:serine/threonine protein kinase
VAPDPEPAPRTPADIPLGCEESLRTAATHAGDSAAGATRALPSDAPPVIPDVTFEKTLGRGGMGTVFKGRQITLDRAVAVKAIHPALAQDRSFVERFEREAKVLAKLAHANIVACYQAGRCGATGQHYLLMEFVEGHDLLKHVKGQGPLGEHDALAIALQVAEGLEHALEAGVIHRDVKPENILLKPVSRAATWIGVQAKIVDLGLAALARPDPDSLRLTAAGTALGTPLTMAPEQADAPDSVDHRADIYALGCTLFFAVTGRFPHEGNTVAQVLSKKLRDETPDARSLRADLGEGTARLIRKMMSFEPANRPGTYDELTSLLASEVARFPGPPQRASTRLGPNVASDLKEAAPPEASRKEAPPPGEGPPLQQTSRLPRVALAALLVIAAGAGVFMISPRTASPPPPAPIAPLPPPPTVAIDREPPRLGWGDPWQAFGVGDQRFEHLDREPPKAWLKHGDDEDDDVCNVQTKGAPAFGYFKCNLDGAVRVDGFVIPKTTTELGLHVVLDAATLDVSVQCLGSYRPGLEPPETERQWELGITSLSDGPPPKTVARVKGMRLHLSSVLAQGTLWARLRDVPGSGWVKAPAPGKLTRLGLYVKDGVGAFTRFTVETAHEERGLPGR